MAYRRRQGISRSSTFKEEIHDQNQPSLVDSSSSGENINNNHNNSNASSASVSALFSSYSFSPSSSNSSSSLAAQAIKASAARRDPSLSFAFEPPDHQRSKSFDAYGDASGRGDRYSKSGFWGVLAQKAKSILEDDNPSHSQQHDDINVMPQTLKSNSFNNASTASQAEFKPLYQSPDLNRKMDNPKFRKGLDAITSSLNQLGDTFEKAFEEGRTIVESKTADLRTQIRRKGGNGPGDLNQAQGVSNTWQQSPQTQSLTSHETQLKASRDVAMATAAKAKLLLRELKTVKADLAFAKARCAQLEEENKLLRDREGSEKGQNRADDDLIRLQLETLLAEKARLANENETYSRENRFLREIVEYHQLTMQDVVYLDEGMEEVTEVYPIDPSGLLSGSLRSSSPPSPSASPPVHTEEDKSTSENEIPSISVSENAK